MATPSLDRRGFLVLGGAAAIAAGLAACTPGTPGPGAPSPTPTGWTPPPEPMPIPGGFTWGAATSAFQVEGSTTADGRGPSIWDTFAAQPGNVRGGATGDPAADQYRRWEQDLDILTDLGLASYRFSIAWPRIQPTGAGPVNQRGLDHYRRLIGGLIERGLTPAITLYHWDLPQALQDAGGWPNRDTALRFADYADLLFEAFGDAGALWFTLNEPKTQAFVGHWYGGHAPGIQDPDAAAAVVHHQLLAHGLAVQALRARTEFGRIGIPLNLLPVYPVFPNSEKAVARLDASENRLFLDPLLRGSYPEEAFGQLPGQLPASWEKFTALHHDGDLATISTPTDFLAIQYYGVTGVDDIGNPMQLHPTSNATWQQVWPEGLYDLVTRLHRDYSPLPIYLTENGIPDESAELTTDDPYRVEFLRTHLQQVSRALADGVPVAGHYTWSLLDNFEWAEGYNQRWGIVAVDFETQARTRKASADFLAQVVAAGAVPPN